MRIKNSFRTLSQSDLSDLTRSMRRVLVRESRTSGVGSSQLVEHCSANAEAMGSNRVEALSVFGAKTCKCLNCDYNCDDHVSISSVFPQLKSTSFHVSFLSRIKMNSINWSAPNIWVFIAQLVESTAALTPRPWVRIPLRP